MLNHLLNPKTFPTVLIVLNAAAAVPYLWQGNWRKTAYWLAAAVITYVYTY